MKKRLKAVERSKAKFVKKLKKVGKKLAIPKIKLPVKKIRLRPVDEEDMFLHGGYLHHPETRKHMLGWK